MNEKRLQSVTYEQAKRLKRLGFNYETDDYTFPNYDYICTGQKYRDWNYPQNGECISVPTVALTLKFIRDKKGLYGLIDRNPAHWYFCICNMVDGIVVVESYDLYNDYEDVENALLDELITLLEETGL